MQDRPSAAELLEAVRAFLEEQVVPALEGTRQFHARVAANVLAIVGRELAQGDDNNWREWRALGALLEKPTGAPPETSAALAEEVRRRNEELAARIRAGDADGGPWRAAVLAHLRATSTDRLAIANPKYGSPREH
jgi:uncharacterized protein DUF6285